MQKCPVCGREIYQDEKFCMGCGAPILRCPKCGTPNKKGSRFCISCGSVLTQDASGDVNKQSVPPVSPTPVTPAPAAPKKKSSGALIAVIVLLALIVGGFGVYQFVVVPKRHAAAVAEVNASNNAASGKKEETKKGTAGKKDTGESDARKALVSLAAKKNDFDRRLSKAADTINSGHPNDAEKPLKDLNKEIDSALNELASLNGTDEMKTAMGELKQLLQYERQRSDGMIRGIHGDGAGYKDGGEAFDKYQELNKKFEAHFQKIFK
jgi:uncharacterized membrane protein YvbJ